MPTRILDVGQLYRRVDYEPHPGQLLVHANKPVARFRVVCAGRRWGKSKSGPHDLIPDVFSRTPKRIWIVAPTYDLGEKEFRVFWEVLIEKLQIPVVKTKTANNPRTKDFRITTEWGTVIEVRSAEHPDSLVGEGLDSVIMAEAAKLKLSHWQKNIRPALADKRGSALFVSTPEGFNWFYDLWQQGQQRKKYKDWWSLQSPSWDNTKIFPGGFDDEEIQEALLTMATEFFDQEIAAKFTSFAGRIYPEFDEGYHVLPDYEFNPQWPNYLSFDFGFRNPFVCLNIQVDPQDNVYVWDEYYDRNITTPEHARRLKSIIEWRVDGGYHDPAGPDQAGSLLTVFHDTKEYNNTHLNSISLEPSPNDWELGVGRVKQWLKLNPHEGGLVDANGDVMLRPKLFVASSCVNTIKEFNTYRTKEQTEKMKDQVDPREEPRKKDDHCMDALRYFITGHFGLESHYGYAN